MRAAIIAVVVFLGATFAALNALRPPPPSQWQTVLHPLHPFPAMETIEPLAADPK